MGSGFRLAGSTSDRSFAQVAFAAEGVVHKAAGRNARQLWSEGDAVWCGVVRSPPFVRGVSQDELVAAVVKAAEVGSPVELMKPRLLSGRRIEVVIKNSSLSTGGGSQEHTVTPYSKPLSATASRFASGELFDSERPT